MTITLIGLGNTGISFLWQLNRLYFEKIIFNKKLDKMGGGRK